ncbi:hypothetical protein CASFOL_031295 [Castilleja foliolosa]|uniref:Uncharacterized protein n=1 Tax=Castilleja foliolosa TaxID=1961234 RepID=A0ABD3C4Y9_9LAMI
MVNLTAKFLNVVVLCLLVLGDMGLMSVDAKKKILNCSKTIKIKGNCQQDGISGYTQGCLAYAATYGHVTALNCKGVNALCNFTSTKSNCRTP